MSIILKLGSFDINALTSSYADTASYASVAGNITYTNVTESNSKTSTGTYIPVIVNGNTFYLLLYS